MDHFAEPHTKREKHPKFHLESLSNIKTKNSISGNQSYSQMNPNIKFLEIMEEPEFGEKAKVRKVRQQRTLSTQSLLSSIVKLMSCFRGAVAASEVENLACGIWIFTDIRIYQNKI